MSPQIVIWLGFAAFGSAIIYLISVFQTLRRIRENEPELWEILGKPSFAEWIRPSLSITKGVHDLVSQLKFFRWILLGKVHEITPGTAVQLKQTRFLLLLSLILFVFYFVSFYALLSLRE